MDANTEADSRSRSSRCDRRDRDGFGDFTQPRVEPDRFLADLGSAPAGFLPIFLLGDTDTSSAARAGSSTCSITASSSSSSAGSSSSCRVDRRRPGSGVPLTRLISTVAVAVSFPPFLVHFLEHRVEQVAPRHAGDRDCGSRHPRPRRRWRACDPRAPDVLLTHPPDRLPTPSGIPVHGDTGSRSNPRTSATMCSCGGSRVMALSRSASLSEDPSSRDWRMAASFSCAGPMAGRFRPAREAEPDEA